ncbi:MAG TPA: glycosyltransferase family 9 protein [bacterium]|nr:glycosyltransferase family 9 protein [bacterium]
MSASTLVLAAGSLGDSLLTLPALQFLQTKGPVTLAGTSPYQKLGAACLGVEKVIALDPLLDALHRKDPNTLPGTPGGLYVFFKDKDAGLAESLAAYPGWAVHWPPQSFTDFLKQERWVGHYWLDLVGHPDPSPIPRLVLTEEMRTRGAGLCARLGTPRPFVIHPGSGSPAKNAPLSFFRKAAEKTVQETTRAVLVLWGEAETGWLDDIRKAFEGIPRATLLPGPLSLIDLAALLSQAGGYLGNDSGVTQLASACGAKTFAVFNTTDPRLWGPQEAVILAAMGGNF